MVDFEIGKTYYYCQDGHEVVFTIISIVNRVDFLNEYRKDYTVIVIYDYDRAFNDGNVFSERSKMHRESTEYNGELGDLKVANILYG